MPDAPALPASLQGDPMAEAIWAGKFDFMGFYAWCRAHDDDSGWGLKARAFRWGDRAIDRADEMDRSVLGLSFTAFTALEDMGLDRTIMLQLMRLNWIGRLHGETLGSGRWQPVSDRAAGKPMLLLPVAEEGVLVDIVAFSPRDPDEWSLRTGQGLILGWDMIDRQTVLNFEPGNPIEIRVFANPLTWLTAWREQSAEDVFGPHWHLMAADDSEGACINHRLSEAQKWPPGICILEWSDLAISMLCQLGRSVVLRPESPALARHLKMMMQDLRPLPGVAPFDGQELTLEAAE